MCDDPDYSHTCTNCGHTGEAADFTDGSDVMEATGALACPECGFIDMGDD